MLFITVFCVFISVCVLCIQHCVLWLHNSQCFEFIAVCAISSSVSVCCGFISVWVYQWVQHCLCAVQDFVGDTQDVIVEVEPAQQDSSHNTSEASSEPAPSSIDESTPLTSDGRHSPARNEGSINAAFTSSGSSEDDGNTTTAGRGGKRKKTKSNHVV